MSDLLEKYKKEIGPLLKEKLGYENIMAVPKLEKVIINTSFGSLLGGKSTEERKKIEDFIFNELSSITGQIPLRTKAKRSVSGFKLRRGMTVGMKVTLRGKRMYDFVKKLIHAVLPRIRDFRGISSKSIDKEGNLNIGIKEHLVFPEILSEKILFPFGLEITLVCKALKREDALEFFKLLGFPIK